MSRPRGFTLIELLVVIAIIALLSSVVLAALNSARTKGQIAAVKSNLRNMISAQELAYDSVSPNAYPTASTTVLGMLTAIANAGGTGAYYSFDGKRWGASAKLNADSTNNYSVDSSGVVTWDTNGVNSSGGFVTPDVGIPWNTAVAACAAAGGRLPTFEQLKALSLAYNSITPPSFQSGWYWSGTEIDIGSAYSIAVFDGHVSYSAKTDANRVRCVR